MPESLPRRSRKRSWFLIFAAVVALYAISPLAHYGIPTKGYVETSPSGRYRVEYYTPHYSPYAFFAYRHAFFIKVYNNERKRYVYTSHLDEHDAMFPIMWPEEIDALFVSHGIRVPKNELE